MKVRDTYLTYLWLFLRVLRAFVVILLLSCFALMNTQFLFQIMDVLFANSKSTIIDNILL